MKKYLSSSFCYCWEDGVMGCIRLVAEKMSYYIPKSSFLPIWMLIDGFFNVDVGFCYGSLSLPKILN
jgi:hypothetical protein